MEKDALEKARQAIDRIDGEMARLFQARMEAVAQVAAYKAEQGLPILDGAREAQVLERNLDRLPPGHPLRAYYRDFLQYNMALSRQYQAGLLGRDTVAYQGVPGAFSHIALSRLFPHARALACPPSRGCSRRCKRARRPMGCCPLKTARPGTWPRHWTFVWPTRAAMCSGCTTCR